MTLKLLTELNLKGSCTGSSESTLVNMPHCWKSHVSTEVLHFQTGNNSGADQTG